jgi:phospholipid/cholesterol/gamma-HCH transport system permease protein
MPLPATIVATEEARRSGDGGIFVTFRAAGSWLVATAAEIDGRLGTLELPHDREVNFDLAGIERLDTAGAWLLLRTERELVARGNRVVLTNLSSSLAPLLEQVRAHGSVSPLPHPIPPHHTLVGFFARLGEVSLTILRRLYVMLGFGGLVAVTIVNTWRQPRRLRLVAMFQQMEQVGLDAMPIIGLLSFLIGIVMAYQGADQLRRFGAEIYTVDLLGISIMRELGALMAAIIIAGRSGSAFTAQIGTMQINQEVDALRTLGLDPIEVLVLPRVFGLVATLPLLVFYADAMGLLGGCLMTWLILGIPVPGFLAELRGAVTQWTLWVGVIKAPFFAGIISMVGCYEGFSVSGSAESIGRLTTQSVVESIFFVIVADAAFSILFSVLRI